MRAVMFHNVIAECLDPYDRTLQRLHQNRFERTIAHCREHYEILGFPAALERLVGGEDTSRVLTITFDDGFAGVCEAAWPVMAKWGLVGTVFIMTERGDCAPVNRLMEFERLEIALRLTSVRVLELPWLGLETLDIAAVQARTLALRRIKQALKRQQASIRQASLSEVLAALGVDEDAITEYAEGSQRYRKLSAAQVQTLLSEGWTIGGHTRSHFTLKGLDEATLRDEVEGNALDLATALGLSHAPFAYPYGASGDFDQRVQQAVEAAGFSAAFTTIPGDNGSSTNLFRLCRFSDTALLLQRGSLGRAV